MNGDGPAPRIGQPYFDAILDEQKSRWDRGERPLVEDLLARHPTLGEDAEATLDVIYQEFVIRRALGESPSPEAYLRRFPAWADALVHQFAVDAALRPVNEVTVQPTDPGATGLGPLSTPDGIMPPAPLRSIDGHDILGELGRGGMGIVFKALDRRLNRVVAIKMVSETTFTAPAQLRRFLAEAEVIARLSHPNIIPVYAVGEEQGRPYFSVELAEGGNLSERLAKGPITSRQAAELVETLAHAVSAAHAAGIIHRDLKPSNVLLGHDGVPKISDFGLAKLLGDDSARTLSGEVLGTPSYMAPEQAEGRSLDVGPAADIYALGAILFQALTGRPPFLGASAIETMKLVVSTKAVAPRRLRPDVPRDLEQITLKCLEKDPRGRYTDAAALAADLRRFLDGRPIAARPVGPLGRLWRWSRRNPWVAAFLLALGLGAIGSAWQAVRATGAERAAKLAEAATRKEWDRAQTERGRAQAERDRAEAERNRAEKSRDRAISAVQVLVGTVTPEMRSEESRPYRQAVIAAGLRESTALVRELEGDPRAEFQRVHAYMALAHLEHERGEHAAAVELVRKAIPLAESLVARDPTSVLFRSELGSALHYLTATLPDGESCRSAARRSNEIFQALVASHPEGNRRGWLQSIALNHYNVGKYACSSGRQTEGIEELLAARTACETALRLGDCGAEVFDLNALILMHLCRAFRGANRFDDSTGAGRRAVELLRLLVHDHPDDIGHALQLSSAHD